MHCRWYFYDRLRLFGSPKAHSEGSSWGTKSTTGTSEGVPMCRCASLCPIQAPGPAKSKLSKPTQCAHRVDISMWTFRCESLRIRSVGAWLTKNLKTSQNGSGHTGQTRVRGQSLQNFSEGNQYCDTKILEKKLLINCIFWQIATTFTPCLLVSTWPWHKASTGISNRTTTTYIWRREDICQ